MSYIKSFSRASSAKVGKLESKKSGESREFKDKTASGSQDPTEESENVDVTNINSTDPCNGSVTGKTVKTAKATAFGGQRLFGYQSFSRKERKLYEKMTASNFENSRFWQLRLESDQDHFRMEKSNLEQKIGAMAFEQYKIANSYGAKVEKLRQQLNETVQAKNKAFYNETQRLQRRIDQLEEENTLLKSRVEVLQAEARSDEEVALTILVQRDAEISELRDDVGKLQEQKGKLEVRNENLRKEVKRISKLVQDIRDANLEENDNLQTEIDELRSEKLDLQTHHDQAIRELKANFNVERANDTVHWHSRLDVKDKEIKEI
ncbi:hypothetical protein HDU76_012724, partial [Blyttiomyces sp. JEL0837]